VGGQRVGVGRRTVDVSGDVPAGHDHARGREDRDAVLALHPGLALTELRATGGGSRNAAWNALKAEVLDMPLLAVQRGGGAPAGAALVAAASVGAVADLAASARAWVRLGPAVRPSGRSRELYRARTARYGRLLTGLAALSRDEDLGSSRDQENEK